MSDRIRVKKDLIEPCYSQTCPNETIELGETAVQFTFANQVRDAKAQIRMSFLPKDDLTLTIPIAPAPDGLRPWMLTDDDWEKNLTLTDRNVSFEANCIRATGGRESQLVYSPKATPLESLPPSSALVSAKFHLFNFPDFCGPENYVLVTGEAPLEGFQSCGRAVLKADGWIITIAATGQTGELTKLLRRQGGYVITHIAEVTREDGSIFTSQDLTKLQAQLHLYLSFVLGRWAGLALPVGVDAAGNRAYESWGLGKAARDVWNGSSSCFDLHHGEFISQVYPGFVALWNKPHWQTAINHALYWYLGAGERGTAIGVDTSLILAQTALEGLAWTYCVVDRKLVLPDAFKARGITTANKFRMLVSSMDIPLEIPSEFAALHAKAQPAWKDSMDAITSIRNSLVHSDGSTTLPGGSYYDAYRLALWYIDMILLRLFKYDGKYANRFRKRYVGSVENVPWVST